MVYLFIFLNIYYLYSFVTFLNLWRGEGGLGFIFLPFCYYLYCVLSFRYHFFLVSRDRDVSLFFILKIVILCILSNFFYVFYYFLKCKRGHKLSKNLLRGEGIGLISLFWKEKLVEGWKRKMDWVRVFFFKGSNCWWGRGAWVIFIFFF